MAGNAEINTTKVVFHLENLAEDFWSLKFSKSLTYICNCIQNSVPEAEGFISSLNFIWQKMWVNWCYAKWSTVSREGCNKSQGHKANSTTLDKEPTLSKNGTFSSRRFRCRIRHKLQIRVTSKGAFITQDSLNWGGLWATLQLSSNENILYPPRSHCKDLQRPPKGPHEI